MLKVCNIVELFFKVFSGIEIMALEILLMFIWSIVKQIVQYIFYDQLIIYNFTPNLKTIHPDPLRQGHAKQKIL